jgi:hypothetical protein
MSGLQLQDLRVLATGVGRSRRPYPGCRPGIVIALRAAADTRGIAEFTTARLV